MPPITTLPNTNNISATLIRKELGYANTSGALDIDTVRYMQPGAGETINTTLGSAIAFSDLQGAYLRDYEQYWTYNANVIPRATGTDSLGNIIVGFEDSDTPQYILVKFNPAGNVIWASNISNTSVGVYAGGKILFDWSDNIYAHILVGSPSSVNSSIISLYSNGSLRWNAQEDTGKPITSGNIHSYGNVMEFDRVNYPGINPSLIHLAANGLYKSYNTNNGTVNSYYTVSSSTFTNLDITAFLQAPEVSNGFTFAGTASNTSGQKNAFGKFTITTNYSPQCFYYNNTDNFSNINDIKYAEDNYYLGQGGSCTSITTGDLLLMSSSAAYPDNSKTASANSKISLAWTQRYFPSDDTSYAWDINFGPTRKVIGYKILSASYDFNTDYRDSTQSTYAKERYMLIVGQIVANPSSIFVLAFNTSDSDKSYPGYTDPSYYFPWCYEIASSNSSHDFEISGVPKSIIYDTKTKLLIPVKVSRSSSFIRNSVMSVSLPQISSNTSKLSVSNEGTFGNVSIYPLDPTITRRTTGTIPTQFSITSTKYTGANGTGTTVCDITSNASFITGSFNFIS